MYIAMKPICLLFLIAILIQTGHCLGEECPGRKDPNRKCMKSCARENCKSPRKDCVCDGECGLSCINKNLECQRLGKFTNGKVDIQPFNKFGATATYGCDDGYELKGVKHRVCQGDMKWSDEEPMCILATRPPDKSECKEPPPVGHATHNGDLGKTSYPLGTMLLYKCNEGYDNKAGDWVRAWCVGGGVWAGPRMTCSSPDCQTPKSPENGGILEPFKNNVGSTMTYYCAKGYYLAGKSTRTCLANGIWDGKPPSCERATCGEPPTVSHASHDGYRQSRYPAGKQLMYTCEDGFEKSGVDRTMCKNNGNWTELSLKCLPVICGFPGSLEDGWISGYVFRYPESVEYHCKEGYELIGNRFSQCLPSGEWSASLPKCIAVECPHLYPPENGLVIGSGNAYGTVLRFQCKKDYQLKGSIERRCQANRTWSGTEGTCEEIDCGIPADFWNGFVVGDSSKVGATLFFSCRVRFKFNGTTIDTVCLENGSWSNKPPVCLGQCHVPSVEDARLLRVAEGSWVDHGTRVQYQCKNGFVPSVSDLVECKNGTWSSMPRCIPAPCPSAPPHVSKGWRIFSGRGHGRRAKYICRNGYRLEGMNSRKPFLTCENGRWMGGKPKCTELFCPNPGMITHGTIFKKEPNNVRFLFQEYITTIRHGQRLIYECHEGYVRFGPSGATCINGRWSPPIGDRSSHCKKKMYPPFPKQWTPIPGENFHE